MTMLTTQFEESAAACLLQCLQHKSSGQWFRFSEADNRERHAVSDSSVPIGSRNPFCCRPSGRILDSRSPSRSFQSSPQNSISSICPFYGEQTFNNGTAYVERFSEFVRR